MSVRAKFRCTGVNDRCSITNEGSVEVKVVTLQAVYGGKNDGANAQWSKWTPSGELTMSINNPEAYSQFKLGRCYFIDLTEVTEAD